MSDDDALYEFRLDSTRRVRLKVNKNIITNASLGDIVPMKVVAIIETTVKSL